MTARSAPLEVTPQLSEGDDPAPIVGIVVGGQYDFPIDVTIQLENVGGPSAGMMFALGIIDKLTPGELTGGEAIAGTGTITGDGRGRRDRRDPPEDVGREGRGTRLVPRP